MNAFALTFVAFALAALAWRLWLLARHARHVARHRDRVPPDFADLVPPDAHARAADYTRDKVRVAAATWSFRNSRIIASTSASLNFEARTLSSV